MEDCLIVCRLTGSPPGALPPWGGLVDCAEEHGLYWMRPHGGGFQRLPEGVLWGRFQSSREALAAFDEAVEDASGLLGYPVRVTRRVARLEFSAEPPALARGELRPSSR